MTSTFLSIIDSISKEFLVKNLENKSLFHIKSTNKNIYDKYFNWNSMNKVLKTSLIIENMELIRKGEALEQINTINIMRSCESGAHFKIRNLQDFDIKIDNLRKEITQELLSFCNIDLLSFHPNSLKTEFEIDVNDIFILQIEGTNVISVYDNQINQQANNKEDIEIYSTKKHKYKWTSLREYNLEKTFDPKLKSNYNKPTINDKPVFESIIEKGDFLYIPSGKWYSINSNKEPSIILLLNLISLTGIHFLEWLLNTLTNSKKLNNILPLFNKETISNSNQQLISNYFNKMFIDKFATLFNQNNYKKDFFLDVTENILDKPKIEFP